MRYDMCAFPVSEQRAGETNDLNDSRISSDEPFNISEVLMITTYNTYSNFPFNFYL